MTHAELVSALSRGDAYPTPPCTPVTTTQTHISILFFAGDRVYKVKKALALDFLDYSTLERRRHFCEEEVRLNRRLAPDVYLGVVPINHADDGSIRIDGPGATIEYAVEMVRLPANGMVSELLNRGEITNADLDEIAAVLARFHADAERGPSIDAFGRPDELRRQVAENTRELELDCGTLSSLRRDYLRDIACAWLDDHATLLRRRVVDGRICEGHGDLHAGNICLTRDGVRIYDCIEFSPRFRCRDVACELAFLAMDLDLRCMRGFASYLLHRYATLTDDPRLPDVAWFYKLHLAAVRGKVLSLQANDRERDGEERDRVRLQAIRYFNLAASYALGPALILTCGLPGAGKSHAARAIAAPFEATVLRSDVVRKQMGSLTSPLDEVLEESEIDTGIYTPDFTELTYGTLLETVEPLLRDAKTVVVDATFAAASWRQAFFDRARSLGCPCLLVEVTCPEGVIRERLERRVRDPREASDADWKVYLHAKERFEPPDEIPAASRMRIASPCADEDIASAVIDTLITAR